jgi:GT2 family glycosyltransferase
VSVVIPTKFRVDLLEKGLSGLCDKTGYPALEVVIVDNGCTDSRFPEVLAAARKSLDLVVCEDRGAFNFSRLVNAGVKQSKGEVVLLLNDDVTPIEAGWLHRMVQSALMPAVGAVGARLLYPDGAIQHAGVMLGLGGVAGHLWKGMSRAEADCNPYVSCPGSRLAVSGACLAVRRSAFDEVGGFDEAFPVGFNDIDFCLRLGARNLRTVYRGDAVLIHHEGQSRGRDSDSIAKRRRRAAETGVFLGRWKRVLWDDPYGSPAFDPLLESGDVRRSLMIAT